MKSTSYLVSIVATLVFTTPAVRSTAAQDRATTTAGTVGQWWGMIQRQFVSLADAMPEEKYSFKPTAGAFKDIRELTPGNALDPVDGRYGGPSTRLGIMTLAVWHTSDHYGQLVVYSRMNGVVPPASAGSAR